MSYVTFHHAERTTGGDYLVKHDGRLIGGTHYSNREGGWVTWLNARPDYPTVGVYRTRRAAADELFDAWLRHIQ